MSFAATIQRPLEIGQKISKAFHRNCLHIITVAWTADPKQFQFAFLSSKNKENVLTVADVLLRQGMQATQTLRFSMEN